MDTFGPGRRIGPYRIDRLLGVGGMGAVYEARRDLINRRVALKTLHPHVAQDQVAVGRFFNEAKALSQLEHPGIVHIFDFGYSEEGIAYLAMEFLHGQSLAGRLQRHLAAGQSIPLHRILQIAKEAAEVLSLCHRQGIVHRDLKPENLMLVADPVAPAEERIKVLDFGIAKFLHHADGAAPKTGAKELLGTPMYMSPEQFTAATEVDGKSDVYSLGCLLYEAISGQPPFMASESWQFVGMHLFQTPAPLQSRAPHAPESVYKLVNRLLVKDRNARPDMAQVQTELTRCIAELKMGELRHLLQAAEPGQPLLDPVSQRLRRGGVVAGGIVAIVALVVWQQRGGGMPTRGDRDAVALPSIRSIELALPLPAPPPVLGPAQGAATSVPRTADSSAAPKRPNSSCQGAACASTPERPHKFKALGESGRTATHPSTGANATAAGQSIPPFVVRFTP
jgi:serine/threonine protein kinase